MATVRNGRRSATAFRAILIYIYLYSVGVHGFDVSGMGGCVDLYTYMHAIESNSSSNVSSKFRLVRERSASLPADDISARINDIHSGQKEFALQLNSTEAGE